MKRSVFIIVSAAALSACGPEGTQGSAFIALARDFEGYPSWEKFELPAQGGTDAHVAPARTVYLNKRPPAGSTEWPQGTILVKVLPFDTFAMVKRGGGYNMSAAHGWEWFDLVTASDGSLAIKWRGVGPPAGEKYSAADQTCNTCHGANMANDAVLTQGLLLQ